MKKVLISLLAIGALFSCSKEPVIQDKPVNQDPIDTPTQMTQITFSANLGEMTKVSFDLSSGKVSWEEGGAISIFDGTNNVRAQACEISEDGKARNSKRKSSPQVSTMRYILTAKPQVSLTLSWEHQA